ncbi:MAG: hypothetical protein AB7I27_11085 [Bacteriovoracaceae bacterium]
MFKKTSTKNVFKKLAKNTPSRRQVENKLKRVMKDVQKLATKRTSMMPIKVSFGK